MDKQVFEIGLVGAGAISAGAYTSGVVDFMAFALDCWYAEKNNNAIPPHDVKISVFSGSSAGGMTAALATTFLASDQPFIADENDATSKRGKNKLFDSWVERIDIAHLLATKDLQENDSPVMSLLDSSILGQIAEDGLNVTTSVKRAYLADNFELFLTVTNLRGVPYGIPLAGAAQPHMMSLHADYLRFSITNSPQVSVDSYSISWAGLGSTQHPNKEKLKQAAIATGAFPIGLAPRILDHLIPGLGQLDWYSARTWPVPTPDSQGPHQCTTQESIPAGWSNLTQNYSYHFMCVDGGVMNNEPLELARRFLAGTNGRNKRNGDEADKAVLLIDPFPTDLLFDQKYTPPPDLLKTALGLFTALKNQARFKPEELMLAASESVYSRFMIAPSRDGQVYPIACGSLGGFGGFLKRAFRAHDYFLGRRNAQKFFSDHFALPENNPLFAEWPEAMRLEYCVRDDASGEPKLENDRRFLPIIPLVGKAKQPCAKPTWPNYTSQDMEQLVKQVKDRVDKVVDRLVEQYFKSNNVFIRFGAKWFLGSKKKDLVKFAQTTIAADLQRLRLM